MTSIDPRVFTGPAMIIIGALPLWIAVRLWRVHPINRVLRLGPFVTDRGLRAILNLRIVFLAFGMFFVAQGTQSVTFWMIVGRDINNPFVAALGTLSAGLSIWAASLALRAGWRIWRVK